MTVRKRAEVSRLLAGARIKSLIAQSAIAGEMLIQVMNHDRVQESVYLPSATPIDLLKIAPAAAWKESRSFLEAIQAGFVTVTIKQ